MKTNETAINQYEDVFNDITIPDKPEITLQTPNSDAELIMDMNESFAMKQRLYELVLAPQIIKNEELKREHKTDLMHSIFKILKWQFIATYIFATGIIIMLFFSSYLNISEQLTLEVIAFVKFYITSIIVELISILYFIVKNVFDTSIVDLFRNFDKNIKDKKDITI